MTKLWQVYFYELRRNLQRGGFLFATFGIPLIGLLLMLGFQAYRSFSGQEDPSQLLQAMQLESIEQAGYVDYSGIFADIPANLDEVLSRYDDETSARAALAAGDIDAFFVVDADYMESSEMTLHVPNINLGLLTDGSILTEQLAYRTFASGLDSLTLQRLANPVIFREINLSLDADAQATSEGEEQGQFLIVYIFSLAFFISLMLTNTYLMQTVIDERENRLIEILISAVRPVELLGGKILAMSTLGIFQLLTWIVSMGILYTVAGNLSAFSGLLDFLNLDLRVDLLPLALIYFLLMYLIFAAIFGAIGAVSGSSQEGSQYAGFLMIPTLIPFYFFELIQSNPDGVAATVLSYIPFTAPITMLSRMIVSEVPLWQVLLSVAIVALTAIAAIWMAGRVFRVQTLLSGQRLKPADLPRLIFREHSAV